MLPFTEWQGLNVYSDTVISHRPPSDILAHFNTENVLPVSKGGSTPGELTLDSIALNFSVRYALNLVLKNLSLKFDRKTADLIRACNSPNTTAENGAQVYKLFGTDFNLVYLNPNVTLDFGSSNDPSYYHLFVALARSVNSVLLEPTEPNLANMRLACENLDACLFSDASTSYIDDMLQFYQRIGALDLQDGYVFTHDRVSGISVLDRTKLSTLGTADFDLGFSLSPSGFLIPYHYGILSFLSEYNVINLTVPLAGASSGSLSMCSSVVTNGFINSMNLMESASTRLRNPQNAVSDAAREGESAPENLDDILKSTLYETLTDGCAEFINERIGKITVAYSVIRRLRFKSILSSEFEDLTDLVDCLRVSSYIPMISSTDFVEYKGEPCYDGQLSLNKSLGCADTNAKRTVRVNPYQFTSRPILKQMLNNEYITPHLSKSDKFLEHYIRLKTLTHKLCLRRIVLEDLSVTSEFQKELQYAISLYSKIPAGSTGTRSRTRDISYKNSREYTNLLALWELQNMDLFVSVASTEKSSDFLRHSLSKYEVDANTDIMGKFGSLRRFQKPVHASSVTLLTHLYLQLSPEKAHELESQIPPPVYSIITNRNTTNGSSNPVHSDNITWHHTETLKRLLTHLVPPMTLVYSYCNCDTLISNTVPKKKLFNISLYSSEAFELRYFYDLGRTDAFRWMIQEYIKFENYLFFRLLQLTHSNASPQTKAGNTPNTPTPKDNAASPSLDEMQTQLIGTNLKFISTRGLAKQPSSHSVHYKFFQNLNSAVRTAILANLTDSHFSHIFSHSHFWNSSKHYRF